MGKTETINDRVQKIRKALEMTQQEFADKIKFKTGNTLSMIERGENKVKEQHILLICTPNSLKDGKTINEGYLRYGKGEMFITPVASEGRLKLYDENSKELPVDEEELVGIYRQLSKPNKKVARVQIDALLDGQEDMNEKGERRANTLRKSI